MVDEPAPVSPAEFGDPELHKLLVRLIAGGIGESIDRLRTLAAELEAAVEDPDSETALSFSANPTAMTLVGWMSEWPEQLALARSGVERMTYPATRFLGLVYNTGAAIAEATGISEFVSSVTEPARVAFSEEMDRLSMLGTAEYARGRVLSVHAFERSIDGIVGYLSESDEVSELVREQTLGVTGAAVQEIRETGAAADGLAESVFRRLLGREVRPLPPMPSAEAP